ncbi:MAG: fructosamine kinase family protein [Ignavibacteriaceae bacterium]
MLTAEITRKIEEKVQSKLISTQTVSGGCISDAYKIRTDTGAQFFLKINSGLPTDMFLKESNGLKELRKANTIRIPEVIFAESDFLMTELITPGSRAKNFFENFGRKFAKLHKYSSGEFGFYEDNYIGSNEQKNIPGEREKNNWIEFYFNERILYQYKLAEKLKYTTSELTEGINKLENKIEDILSGSEEKPSLLHGDLWSGNFIVDEKGTACLIDPAVYYGHREADLAMTKLFGGFSSEFYHSYNDAFPLKDGFEYRENIYKLYHVLNHLNLFGGGYYSQAISLIRSYV